MDRHLPPRGSGRHRRGVGDARGACGARAALRLPPPTRISVKITARACKLSRKRVPAGKLVFTLTNKSKVVHSLVVAGRKSRKAKPRPKADLPAHDPPSRPLPLHVQAGPPRSHTEVQARTARRHQEDHAAPASAGSTTSASARRAATAATAASTGWASAAPGSAAPAGTPAGAPARCPYRRRLRRVLRQTDESQIRASRHGLRAPASEREAERPVRLLELHVRGRRLQLGRRARRRSWPCRPSDTTSSASSST